METSISKTKINIKIDRTALKDLSGVNYLPKFNYNLQFAVITHDSPTYLKSSLVAVYERMLGKR